MKYLSFSHEITIYWLYDESLDNASYDIYLNDEYIETINKSSYTFENLKSDSFYLVEVKINGTTIFKEEIKTRLEKNIIKVDLPTDGKKLLTKELQQIIDKAQEDDLIYFPKGTYLTGALFLHDNQEIYLEEDATILGSDNYKDYLPKIHSRFEGIENESYASLINIGVLNRNNKTSISHIYIHGKGTIFGGGKSLIDSIINEEEKYLQNDANSFINAGRKRNRLINISNADDVVISGLHLGQSSSWNIHPIYSKNIFIYNCHIESYGLHNGDGIDPDSSHDVFIFNNVFDVGDDCVALKSGKNPEGNIINIPCYNIYIFDCYSIAGHGCSIGSEISGGIHDVFIFNCDFKNTYHGLQLKTTPKRGAYIRNIHVKNSSFAAICIHTVDYNDDGETSGELTRIENVNINNVSLFGVAHHKSKPSTKIDYIKICGFKEDISAFNNIHIKNVQIHEKDDDKNIKIINDVTNIIVENVVIKD